MWNLDDESRFAKIHSFTYHSVFTYADTRPGRTDKEKREYIRGVAAKNLPSPIPKVAWWAFRIFVRKSGRNRIDIENVPKLIVDAFSAWQISRDNSPFLDLVLYADDTIDHVRFVQVAGKRTESEELTSVEIFGRRLDA
ncbi:MAG: hypothetical protein HY070_11500 [Chloroflexi bacterium]|nr:hypothetical protein [Chloroflexota bacterium]